jgi:hypothetical protein
MVSRALKETGDEDETFERIDTTMTNQNRPTESYAAMRGRTVRPTLSIRGAERQVRPSGSQPVRFGWSGMLTSRR